MSGWNEGRCARAARTVRDLAAPLALLGGTLCALASTSGAQATVNGELAPAIEGTARADAERLARARRLLDERGSFADLRTVLEELAASHPESVGLEIIGRSRGDRPIWLVRLGARDTRRPSMLLCPDLGGEPWATDAVRWIEAWLTRDPDPNAPTLWFLPAPDPDRLPGLEEESRGASDRRGEGASEGQGESSPRPLEVGEPKSSDERPGDTGARPHGSREPDSSGTSSNAAGSAQAQPGAGSDESGSAPRGARSANGVAQGGAAGVQNESVSGGVSGDGASARRELDARGGQGGPPALVPLDRDFPSGWTPELSSADWPLSRVETAGVARALIERRELALVALVGKVESLAPRLPGPRPDRLGLPSGLGRIAGVVLPTADSVAAPGGLAAFCDERLALPVLGFDRNLDPPLARRALEDLLAALPRIELEVVGSRALPAAVGEAVLYEVELSVRNAGALGSSGSCCRGMPSEEIQLRVSGGELRFSAWRPHDGTDFRPLGATGGALSLSTLPGGEVLWVRLYVEAEAGTAIEVACEATRAGRSAVRRVLGEG